MPDFSNQYTENFKPLPVAELLTGDYSFAIPSYQRGYRWERKQVRDLLDDIYAFSKDDCQTSYYLQPIVVRPSGSQWEVLDGQQRLTTMLLVLRQAITWTNENVRDIFNKGLYNITYNIRPQLDFDNPDFKKTIDGFYLAEAKEEIVRWFKQKALGGYDISPFLSCLLYRRDVKKQVKFIWYVSDKGSGYDGELNSINVFNRLNKGKIGLTSSELIKALFVLDLEKKEKPKLDKTEKEETASDQLVMEWNEIERKFQDDRFWYFISNDRQSAQTRIDLLFDFLTLKKGRDDSDYSYRLFQNLFDHCESDGKTELNDFWKTSKIENMTQAWRKIKKTFDLLVSWYEDNLFYHYVGFLVNQNSSPMDIHRDLEEKKKAFQASANGAEWTRQDSEKALREMIRKKFNDGNFGVKNINELEYSDSANVRKLLLLFNIELCVKTENQRFKFDDYKTEEWDIEHIDSQNDSVLQKPADRLQWLRNVIFILKIENSSTQDGKALLTECESLCAELDKLQKEEMLEFKDDRYKDIYKKVNKYFSFDASAGDKSVNDVDLTSKNKDDINNLTLLNSSINRSYKDAPFPYKRYFIIEKDKEGKHFIPIGTRNLFLKYYTSSEKSVSQLQSMRWNEGDKECYLEYIHTIVDPFFN